MEKVISTSTTILPPNHKLVKLFGSIARVTSKSKCGIISMVPIDDGGTSVFDYILQVANEFDDTIINNDLYNFWFEQLSLTYQKHVFCKLPHLFPENNACSETLGLLLQKELDNNEAKILFIIPVFKIISRTMFTTLIAIFIIRSWRHSKISFKVMMTQNLQETQCL